jgi:hypothetical protein
MNDDERPNVKWEEKKRLEDGHPRELDRRRGAVEIMNETY